MQQGDTISKFNIIIYMNAFSLRILLMRNHGDIINQQLKNLAQQINIPIDQVETSEDGIKKFQQYKHLIIICQLGSCISEYYQPLVQHVRSKCKISFICIFSVTASRNALMRQNLFDEKVNMVSECIDTLKDVIQKIQKIITSNGEFHCNFCEAINMSEDGIWAHLQLYHCNEEEENLYQNCQICNRFFDNIQVHFRNCHGPCGRGEIENENKPNIYLNAFSLVVVRRKSDNKYLLVQEYANIGFWLPGGRVDPGEGLIEAGIRECKEEAGIDIKITGILQAQFSSKSKHARLRMIYLAEPIDENQKPKSLPDYETVGASYVSVEDISKLRLRGKEPLVWIPYVDNGGIVYPLEVFSKEY